MPMCCSRRRTAPKSRVRRLWYLDETELVTSDYAAEEARRNLKGRGQRIRLGHLLRRMARVEAKPRRLPRGIKLPAKDWPILQAALSAKASHLLTGDVRHFGDYFGRTILGTIIMLPGEYLASREQEA